LKTDDEFTANPENRMTCAPRIFIQVLAWLLLSAAAHAQIIPADR